MYRFAARYVPIAVTLIAATACSHLGDTQSLPAWADNWSENCLELRGTLAERPDISNINITFQGRPENPLQGVEFWRLDWHGVAIPVPPAAYKQLAIEPEGGLLLQSDDKVLRTLSFPRITRPIDDVFARRALAGLKPEGAKSGKELTKTVWGTVSELELSYLGFTVTPAELGCSPEDWKREMKVATALAQKQGNPPTLRNIYRIPDAGPRTMLARVAHGANVEWVALIPSRNNSGPAVGIRISLPKNASRAQAGFGIGMPESFHVVKGPGVASAAQPCIGYW